MAAVNILRNNEPAWMTLFRRLIIRHSLGPGMEEVSMIAETLIHAVRNAVHYQHMQQFNAGVIRPYIGFHPSELWKDHSFIMEREYPRRALLCEAIGIDEDWFTRKARRIVRLYAIEREESKNAPVQKRPENQKRTRTRSLGTRRSGGRKHSFHD